MIYKSRYCSYKYCDGHAYSTRDVFTQILDRVAFPDQKEHKPRWHIDSITLWLKESATEHVGRVRRYENGFKI